MKGVAAKIIPALAILAVVAAVLLRPDAMGQVVRTIFDVLDGWGNAAASLARGPIER